MSYRLAKSLEKLRSQINAMHPNRDKASDGWIGDARHQSSTSDHNPWVRDGKTGVVTALDIDKDLSPTVKIGPLVDVLVAVKDPRVKYIIWNSRMISSYPAHGYAAWQWRPYSGKNKHTEHVHVSVKANKEAYDNEYPWTLTMAGVAHQPIPEPFAEDVYVVQSGDNLSKIAASFKMPWTRLMELNGLTSDRIRPGDRLKLK